MEELEKRGEEISRAMGIYRGTEPLIEAVRRMSDQLFNAERELRKRRLPNIEEVSAKVHAVWMMTKFKQGVTTRLSEKGEELMRPYLELSEEAKELDRGTVRTVYEAIEAASNEKSVSA